MNTKSLEQKPEKIETRPDGWERFESAIDVALKKGKQKKPKLSPPKKDKFKSGLSSS